MRHQRLHPLVAVVVALAAATFRLLPRPPRPRGAWVECGVLPPQRRLVRTTVHDRRSLCVAQLSQTSRL
eukprot:231855-Chlamydomonas_euryale.AAC.2